MSTAMTPASPDNMSALESSATPHVLDYFYQMNVDEYERLADAEFLKYRRVELINRRIQSPDDAQAPTEVREDAQGTQVQGAGVTGEDHVSHATLVI